jgi:hypothetical protein
MRRGKKIRNAKEKMQRTQEKEEKEKEKGRHSLS